MKFIKLILIISIIMAYEINSKPRSTCNGCYRGYTKETTRKLHEYPVPYYYWETYYDPVYTPNNYYSYAPYDSPSGFYYW